MLTSRIYLQEGTPPTSSQNSNSPVGKFLFITVLLNIECLGGPLSTSVLGFAVLKETFPISLFWGVYDVTGKQFIFHSPSLTAYRELFLRQNFKT